MGRYPPNPPSPNVATYLRLGKTLLRLCVLVIIPSPLFLTLHCHPQHSNLEKLDQDYSDFFYLSLPVSSKCPFELTQGTYMAFIGK